MSNREKCGKIKSINGDDFKANEEHNRCLDLWKDVLITGIIEASLNDEQDYRWMMSDANLCNSFIELCRMYAVNYKAIRDQVQALEYKDRVSVRNYWNNYFKEFFKD